MDVSVVVLTFNSENYIKNCLDSIFAQTKDVNFEVIVVDNQSQDKTVEILKSYGSKVKLIISPENGGYTKGNNLGIKASKGNFVLIANPDTQLVENTVQRLKIWLDAHNDVGAVAPQLLDVEQNEAPISSAASFPNLLTVFLWAFFIDDLPFISKILPSYHPHTSMSHWNVFRKKGTKEDVIKQVERQSKVAPEVGKETYPDWVHGSFWMIRREAIDKVGLLDENIFMYGEELEWCIRAKRAGWKIAYTPISKVIHVERGSAGGESRGWVLGEFKGLKYIYGKHESVWKQLILGSLLDVAAFLRVIFWLVRLKPQMAKIYVEALLL